jgi:hypothetical protein
MVLSCLCQLYPHLQVRPLQVNNEKTQHILNAYTGYSCSGKRLSLWLNDMRVLHHALSAVSTQWARGTFHASPANVARNNGLARWK